MCCRIHFQTHRFLSLLLCMTGLSELEFINLSAGLYRYSFAFVDWCKKQTKLTLSGALGGVRS